MFLHRAPVKEDDDKLSLVKDIFGRDRHSDDRDDMGGVGTFNCENTSLYVNGLVRPRQGWDVYESMVRKAFGACGTIRSVKLHVEKGFMFVRYQHRSSAEFAKECMAGQDLGNGEVLNVRWATEDPNPGVKRREAAAAQKQSLEARITEERIQFAKGTPIYQLPLMSQLHQSRLQAEAQARNIPYDPNAYPNTDAQYRRAPAESPDAAADFVPSQHHEVDPSAYPDTSQQYRRPGPSVSAGTVNAMYRMGSSPKKSAPAELQRNLSSNSHPQGESTAEGGRSDPGDTNAEEDDGNTVGLGLVNYDSSSDED